MKRAHLIAGAAVAAAVAGGTAIAATNSDKRTEQAVLSDAAKRLGVSPDQLRSALGQAEDAQLDAAVKAGRLTQAQADELRQHRQAEGSVLGFGPHGPEGFDHRRGGPFLLDDAAKAIGISATSLMRQLHDGTTLGAIAKAHGKSLDDVKAAVKQAATDRIDADLKAGRITKEQHDWALSELDEHLDRLGDFDRFGPPPPPGRRGRWEHAPRP
jgi:methylphosphotriester-DNA--protein-cysteine methyltransferase